MNEVTSHNNIEVVKFQIGKQLRTQFTKLHFALDIILHIQKKTLISTFACFRLLTANSE